MQSPFFYCLSIFLISNFIGTGAVGQKNSGPTVNKDGILVKNGMLYRGIGVNYFDAFSRTLHNPNDTSYQEGFNELSQLKIPFVRMTGGGFWPKDWKLYFDDKTKYFDLMDNVVKSAEENEVGLIISLFWHSPTVPDLVGEPRDQWGNPQSKTMEFMRNYVHEVVVRYKDSPAIYSRDTLSLLNKW